MRIPRADLPVADSIAAWVSYTVSQRLFGERLAAEHAPQQTLEETP
jgi:hypothetical protein